MQSHTLRVLFVVMNLCLGRKQHSVPQFHVAWRNKQRLQQTTTATPPLAPLCAQSGQAVSVEMGDHWPQYVCRVSVSRVGFNLYLYLCTCGSQLVARYVWGCFPADSRPIILGYGVATRSSVAGMWAMTRLQRALRNRCKTEWANLISHFWKVII